MTTPFEAKGWKATDKFRVVDFNGERRFNSEVKIGDVVTLNEDDNSNSPYFNNETTGVLSCINIQHLQRIEPVRNGEGLPPVGTECEYVSGVLTQAVGDNKPVSGTYVTVVAHDSYTSGNGVDVCICKWLNSNGGMRASVFAPKTLRPIRSERDKAVDDMVQVSGITDGAAKILYDAGWRKI